MFWLKKTNPHKGQVCVCVCLSRSISLSAIGSAGCLMTRGMQALPTRYSLWQLRRQYKVKGIISLKMHSANTASESFAMDGKYYSNSTLGQNTYTTVTKGASNGKLWLSSISQYFSKSYLWSCFVAERNLRAKTTTTSVTHT